MKTQQEFQMYSNFYFDPAKIIMNKLGDDVNLERELEYYKNLMDAMEYNLSNPVPATPEVAAEFNNQPPISPPISLGGNDSLAAENPTNNSTTLDRDTQDQYLNKQLIQNDKGEKAILYTDKDGNWVKLEPVKDTQETAIIVKRYSDKQYVAIPESEYGDKISFSDLKAALEFLPMGSGNLGVELGTRLAFFGIGDVIDTDFDIKSLAPGLVNDSAGLFAKYNKMGSMENYFKGLGLIMSTSGAKNDLDKGLYESNLFDYMSKAGIPRTAASENILKAQIQWAESRYNNFVPVEDTAKQWQILNARINSVNK